MDEKTLALLSEKMEGIVDGAISKHMEKTLEPAIAEKVQSIVSKMRFDQAVFGQDASRLTNEQKSLFAEQMIQAKAQLADDTNSGGVLIAPEVYAGIMRIAKTVGLVTKYATTLPINSQELSVPNYVGSALEGGYLDSDTEGSETSVDFGNTLLTPKQWYVLIRIDNRLLRKASVQVADWLIGLIAEGLASNLDKRAFVGTTPFKGILEETGVPAVVMTGKYTYADFDDVVASEMISNIEESLLDGSAFYMHRTLLHKLRTKVDANGDPIISKATPVIVSELGSGLKPQAYLHNFPVFTEGHMPKTSDLVQDDKPFVVFGNLKGVIFGEGSGLELARSEHATVGGKSTFATNQIALRALNEHALAVGLKEAFVVAKTANQA